MNTPRRPKPRRPGQSSGSTILLIVVAGLTAAGFFYYQRMKMTRMAAARQLAAAQAQLRARAKAATAPGAAMPADGRPIATAPDQAEARTPMVILAAGRAGPVVSLGRPEASREAEDTRGTRRGLLERELVRQAILIAARDGLRASTRDELLDGSPPARGDGPPIEVATLFRPALCRAVVRRGEGETAEVLLAEGLAANPDSIAYLPQLTSRAEALSRGAFPAMLKRLGLQGEPNRVRDDAPVPPGVEDRLDRLGFVDQVAVIRALHQAIRADGESPARLSALARAYAQLGVLTEYQWNPMHRAFKARALLYAQRLEARRPDNPLGLRTRAFVLALVGRHDLALAALDRAGNLDEKAAPPPWQPILEAYLKSDTKRLASREGPHAHLAALLHMMALEYPHGTRVLLRAAIDLAGRDPDCSRAHDVIASNGQLGERHVATQSGPFAFAERFPARLKEASPPPAVMDLLGRGAEEGPLLAALDEAGLPGADAGEPSWGILAHLAREARFMHALRRVAFMTQKWNVPAGEYLDEVRPMVERHPLYPYLQYLVEPRGAGRGALTGLADRLDLAEIELNQQPMIHALREQKLPVGDQAIGRALAHSSLLARDLAEHIVHVADRRPHFGRVLLTVSPYSAFAMSTLIRWSWKQVEDEVPAWHERVGDAPALVRALADRYIALKRSDEAETYLKRSIEASPDPKLYRELADMYRARGDLQGWRATLDHFLADTEAAGLEHARVRVEIANELMRRKEWAEARPYAEAAAETWAAWAMLCASACNEGLGDWGRAELWIRRTAERYPENRWSSWYLFCARTGHGDIDAARRFALNHLAPLGQRSEIADPGSVGFFYWANGSPKNALSLLLKAEAARPSSLHLFCVILLSDELRDAALRDRKLAEFVSRFERSAPRMVAIARLMSAAIADGDRHPLDEAAVEKELAGMSANGRGNAEFLVGRFLMSRRPDAARKHLKAAVGQSYPWLDALAAESLRSMEAKGAR